MQTFTVTVLCVSIVLQYVAAIAALRLVSVTRGGPRHAWVLISIGLALMALRRTATLMGFFAPSVEASLKGPIAELIALAIAMVMLAGVLQIPRVFEALRRLEEDLRQSQKMEAVGRLAGGVAHDFNNLLLVILGHGSRLSARLAPDDPLRAGADEIVKAGERAAALTRQLLAFSRKDVVRPQVLDLNAVLPDAHKMLRRLIAEDIDLVTLPAPGLWSVKADRGQIEQVITNLATNARDAMPRGGKLTIETANVDLEDARDLEPRGARPGPYVMLAVSDTGCGMDAATRSRLFEPFFTTKEVGKGTGLGLATIYGIVTRSGGYVAVGSAPGRGTTFRVYLPRVEGAPETPPATEPALASSRGSETVLLVEDEERVRALVRGVLAELGYTVIEARGAGEALQIGDVHDGPIHLLLTDLVMPQIGGGELAERLAVVRPEMKVLFMSGYANGRAGQSVLEPTAAFLPKPFTPAALASKVREVLDARAAAAPPASMPSPAPPA